MSHQTWMGVNDNDFALDVGMYLLLRGGGHGDFGQDSESLLRESFTVRVNGFREGHVQSNTDRKFGHDVRFSIVGIVLVCLKKCRVRHEPTSRLTPRRTLRSSLADATEKLRLQPASSVILQPGSVESADRKSVE